MGHSGVWWAIKAIFKNVSVGNVRNVLTFLNLRDLALHEKSNFQLKNSDF